jgi:hypothetical protein
MSMSAPPPPVPLADVDPLAPVLLPPFFELQPTETTTDKTRDTVSLRIEDLSIGATRRSSRPLATSRRMRSLPPAVNATKTLDDLARHAAITYSGELAGEHREPG